MVVFFRPKVSRQMELLLNLLWLLLAMPAFWLWRLSRSAPGRRRSSALQCFLALGCLLVLLFPVVSATDDLRAMRAEMEESPGKRSIGQPGGDGSSSSRSQAQPALAASLASSVPSEIGWYRMPVSASTPGAVRVSVRSGRAPPNSFFA